MNNWQAQALSWWLLATSLAFVATSAGLPIILLVILVAIALTLLFRSNAPWANSLGFYLKLSGIVILIRLAFRVIFNFGTNNSPTLLALPEVNLSLGPFGDLHLFGALTQATFTNAITEGLRLAALILCVAMANSLADPRQLMRSVPAALQEVATSVAIAINLAPQLIVSIQRVRQAQRLRGHIRGFKSLAAFVIPVLEDAIDRSMALAASMDSRGFGRRAELSGPQRFGARFSTFAALLFLGWATAGLIFSNQNQLATFALLISAFAFLAVMLKITSLAFRQTRFRSRKPKKFDWLLYCLSLVILVANFWWLAS